MPERLIDLLRHSGKKIATAESCTGGLLASRITDVPGASEVFDLGIVSYSNAVKHRFLGVPDEILKSFGAVSSQTAEAMAKGVCKAAGADFGVGITGIAGPGGGTAEKPVGLVFFSLNSFEKDCFITRELHLSGSRSEVREETCRLVFETLLSMPGMNQNRKGEREICI